MIKKQIWKDIFEGCAPIFAGFLLALFFCLLVTLCSCKPTERIIEVEKWQHDTTTIVDTVHVIDTKFVHDSIYITEYVKEVVKDSTLTNVSWQHYTYDKDGNVSSMTNYNSSTQHGSTAHSSTESAQTSVSDNSTTHEEISSHNESTGHTDSLQSKEQVKRGLTKWQKFIQVLGYAFLILLVLGLGFGGMRLYGKYKKL